MENKPVIQLLPDQVINKIAAGEVVERPASVMKELFENSLDAGATQVEVEVVRGGRQLVAITDNGCGMSHDQALLSIERHATSKIRSEADIEQIGTLGFRGEALAAISSVSRFTLITRPKEALSGTEIQIAGGKLQDVKETGCPPGTRIEIRNLFFNVPARRKFLRAEQTELSHIRQLFLVHALAHPECSMTLKIDERIVYNLPKTKRLEERISKLYSAGFAEQLLLVDAEHGAYKLTGFLGLPQTARKDRQDQYIFINGRPAAAPVVYHALNEVYHPLIGKGAFPAVFLFIEMEPSLVDVNVHPTKKEVRFRQATALRDAIITTLTQALKLGASVPEIPEDNEPLDLPPATTTATVAPPVRPRFETQGKMEDLLVRPERIGTPKRERPAYAGSPITPMETTEDISSSPIETSGASTSPWGWCRVVGKIGGNYVILETEDGYVLMEPRAAHERVLFEKYIKAVQAHSVPQQVLLSPETVELLPSDALVVRESLGILQELGFGISEFGGDTFIVDALPLMVQDGPVERLLTDISREIESAGRRRGAREMIREKIAQSACQTAVRAREKLSDREIETLVSDLAKTEMPYTSPRGRPTLLFTSFTELGRKFGKK